MRLENKRAEDVTGKDITAIRSNRDSEEQRLDFKRDPYGGTNTDKREMLRDIVAMANAGGGYIVIGIEEDDQSRANGIRPVPDAAGEVERMQDLAATGIAPRIMPLEIRCIPTIEGDIVLVRVPETAASPHMVALHNRTEFWSRHGTIKREMSIEEIRAAFLGDEQQVRLGRIEEVLTRLQEDRTRVTLDSITADTPIRMLSTFTQVKLAMDLQARAQVGEEPYYRAAITPTDVSDWMQLNDEVLELLRDPVSMRHGGWHIRELEVSRIREGAVGTNAYGQELLLLRNGHMEFRHPLQHRSYQWRQSEQEASQHPWLYPYPLIELPVSFFRSARLVYDALDVHTSAEIEHVFMNLRGFVLEPGHPNNVFFGADGKRYEKEEYYGEAEVKDASAFDPDALVHDLTRDFYAAFGFEDNRIPLFDEDYHFQP